MPCEQADRLASADPDYSIRDLFEAISNGSFPSWTFYIQVMTFEQAEKFKWNPFDVTKVHGQFLTGTSHYPHADTQRPGYIQCSTKPYPIGPKVPWS
jgi:hypothetical protein